MSNDNEYIRKRAKSLIIISSGIILYLLAGGKFTEGGSFMGGSIIFEHPETLEYAIIVVFLYSLFRYHLANRNNWKKFFKTDLLKILGGRKEFKNYANKIAQEYGVEFKVKEKDFDSLEEAKVWMIDNQKGRRNLTDGWKWELAQVKRKLLQEKGRENLKTPTGGKDSKTLSINDKVNHNTREEISKDLGWSTGKVAQAEQVWDKAEPEVKEKVKNGELTIGGAYKEVKRERKKRAKLTHRKLSRFMY